SMTSESNAVPGRRDGSESIAPAAMSATRPMYWSVRRELWENRSIYLAPLVVAAVFLFGFMISTIHLPQRLGAALALDPMQQHKLIEQPYTIAALVIMGTTFLVAVFYCLDALHGERRDRSILFWKSLQVSGLPRCSAVCCWSQLGRGARSFYGPRYLRSQSGSSRRLPSTLRISPPCWGTSSAAASQVLPPQRTACRWVRSRRDTP